MKTKANFLLNLTMVFVLISVLLVPVTMVKAVNKLTFNGDTSGWYTRICHDPSPIDNPVEGDTDNCNGNQTRCNPLTGNCSGAFVARYVCDGKWTVCIDETDAVTYFNAVGSGTPTFQYKQYSLNSTFNVFSNDLVCNQTVQVDVFSTNNSETAHLEDYLVYYTGICTGDGQGGGDSTTSSLVSSISSTVSSVYSSISSSYSSKASSTTSSQTSSATSASSTSSINSSVSSSASSTSSSTSSAGATGDVLPATDM